MWVISKTGQGFYQVFASFALPNPASIALHEAMGIGKLGVYRQVGYKLGAWHDVGWWQGIRQPLRKDPLPPRSLEKVLWTGDACYDK